ncbi:MAG TPA: tyrosine-type recombinase/integrase, partial [Mycobacteriales bacterium]|nr:tyrosine-type recombinase/integrase [Mycobacteriales bacterium]
MRRFLGWCTAAGRPAVLDRPTVTAFVAGLLDQGAEASTARSRQLALRRFSAWLVEEGETGTDRLLGVRPPKIDVKVTQVLTDDEVRALVKACAGPEMWHRRDEALVRLMTERGMRAGEAVALTLGDVDLARGLVTIRRGKGGKARTVPVEPQTAKALDRYLRARRAHRLAGTDALWLGDRGKEFTYAALHKG